MKFLEWWLGDRRDPYTWLSLLLIVVIIALPMGPEWLVAFGLLVGTMTDEKSKCFDVEEER